MPCLKKCKCGKNEKYFKLLNDDQIEAFECDECPADAKPSEQSEPSQPEQPSTPSNPESNAPVETAAEKKARLKAEREAAKQAKADENKAE